jgi:hypothetical protein
MSPVTVAQVADLFLPIDVITDRTRRQVDAAIDQMVQAVVEKRELLVQIANAVGARKHAAAAMLQRALELLAAARVADRYEGTRPVVELAARTTFEVTTRARFLLSSPQGDDEFTGMVTDFSKKDKQLARAIHKDAAPLPDFLLPLVDPTGKKAPKDLWSICDALDKLDGRTEGDHYSARGSYDILYRWLSNAAAHGGLGAIRRFTRSENGVLHLVGSPEALTSHWPIPLIAAHIGELAVAVFESCEIPSDVVRASGVVLPGPSHNLGGTWT